MPITVIMYCKVARKLQIVCNLPSLRKCDDFFRKMIIVRGNDPLHFTGDGIMEVGSIPFLLDKTILDKALAD